MGHKYFGSAVRCDGSEGMAGAAAGKVSCGQILGAYLSANVRDVAFRKDLPRRDMDRPMDRDGRMDA